MTPQTPSPAPPPPAPFSAAPLASTGKPIQEQLLEEGFLSGNQLALAEREQQRKGRDLTDILVDLKFIDETLLSSLLARRAQTESISLFRKSLPADALRQVPYELARRCRGIPIEFFPAKKLLRVALADPCDVMAVELLEQATGLQIDVVAAPVSEIRKALAHHYLEEDSLPDTIERLLQEQTRKPGKAEPDDPPLIRLVEQILVHAVKLRASDIHIEPDEKVLRIRMRVDGILHEAFLVPKILQPAIGARLKILADLDLTENRIPQDGRATCGIGPRDIHLRVSSLPTSFGENIVLRILDRGGVDHDLASLDLSVDDRRKLESALEKTFGVILVTGPTGSGKTTTLYAAINAINTLEKSLFTLEDPVEYRTPLIRQTQINEDSGMTFATGLRALLRQDPDIILVGETRDAETAGMMVRAALTGHLVFSTLHTNNAVGAIPRLIDMGIEPYLLPAVLEAIVAQRLVRKLCSSCREEAESTETVFRALDLDVPALAPDRLWKGSGCAACNGFGYSGRTALFEILPVDERLHDAILRDAGTSALSALARSHGMTSLFDDGIAKVLAGKTTLTEVFRVTSNSD